MLIRHYFPFVVIDIVENDQTVIDFVEQKAINDRYTTTNKYDIIFIVNGFNEMTANIRNILNDNGCLVTISLVYKNNKKENAHVMICGDMHSRERIGSTSSTQFWSDFREALTKSTMSVKVTPYIV